MTSARRQQSTAADGVKPDVWGPHVSDRGLNRVSLILIKGLVALGPTVSVRVN